MPGVHKIASGLVGQTKTEPGNRGAGIDGDGDLVSAECFLRVRIFKIELPVAAQKVPVASISGLELRGACKRRKGLQAGEVISTRIANAKVGEKHGSEKGRKNECPALSRTGETKNHPTVLCLEPFGVAR